MNIAVAPLAPGAYAAVYERADKSERVHLEVVGFISNDVGGPCLALGKDGTVLDVEAVARSWNDQERAAAERLKGTTETGWKREVLTPEEAAALHNRSWHLVSVVRDTSHPANRHDQWMALWGTLLVAALLVYFVLYRWLEWL